MSAEALKITERWKSTGLLEGLTQSWIATNMAIMLENQRLFNEQATIKSEAALYTSFRRTSIPLIRRAFGSFIPNNLVSVQAMLDPVEEIFHNDKYGNLARVEVAAKTRWLKSLWPVAALSEGANKDEFVPYKHDLYIDKNILEFFPEGTKFNEENNLDIEARLVAWFASQISNEIGREVVSDLRNNCKRVLDHEYKSPARLYEAVRTYGSVIDHSIGKAANWLVVNLKVAEKLKEGADNALVESNWKEQPHDDFIYYGSIDSKVNIYVDLKSENHDILMGYKGENFDSGYMYCPYVPFGVVEGRIMKQEGTDETVTRSPYLTRYAKKLVDPAYYTNLVVHGEIKD